MKLKGSVRTRSHLEGSICEAYKFDESLTFCSKFLKGYETGQVGNGESMDCEICTTPFFQSTGQALSGKCTVSVEYKTWVQAHRYVLFNYDKIEPYLK